MAKITVPMLPQAREEYDQSQMAQLIQTLEQMIFILNNTYTPVTLSDEEEQKIWFLGQMPNVYTNYKAVLTTSELTTLYTVGSETTAIIKSLRATNIDEENDCKIRAFIVDTDSVSYTLETNRNVQKGTSEELFNSYSFSTSPVVLKESEVLKVQAENGGDLHMVLSVLEIT